MTTQSGGGSVQWWHERIEQHYKAMLARLAEDEALLTEAIMTDGNRLTVTAFRYHGPDMVIIDGQDPRGRPAVLCAQLGSVQILFTIVKNPGPPPALKARARS